jgi:PTH1 family peptidyl-tRNA hydrolase
MKIIVGLGNPGPEYEKTRHNYGWQLIDRLAEEAGAVWGENKKFKALTAQSGDLFFIKPLTFMNNSGQSVEAVLSYYKLLPKTAGLFKIKDADLSAVLTVLHDEIDLPLGEWKFSTDSRSGGHRGVQSIIDHLKTKNFRRLRLGISTEQRKIIPTDKFVLGRFSGEEKGAVEKVLSSIKITTIK